QGAPAAGGAASESRGGDTRRPDSRTGCHLGGRYGVVSSAGAQSLRSGVAEIRENLSDKPNGSPTGVKLNPLTCSLAPAFLHRFGSNGQKKTWIRMPF